jgi:hypothetical protein
VFFLSLKGVVKTFWIGRHRFLNNQVTLDELTTSLQKGGQATCTGT